MSCDTSSNPCTISMPERKELDSKISESISCALILRPRLFFNWSNTMGGIRTDTTAPNAVTTRNKNTPPKPPVDQPIINPKNANTPTVPNTI